jgi:hypothetical protein
MLSSPIRPSSALATRIRNLPVRRARPPLGLAVLAAGVVRQETGAVYEDALVGVGVTDVVEFAFKVVLGAFTAFFDLVLDFLQLADDAVGGADAAVVQGLGEKDGEGEPCGRLWEVRAKSVPAVQTSISPVGLHWDSRARSHRGLGYRSQVCL